MPNLLKAACLYVLAALTLTAGLTATKSLAAAQRLYRYYPSGNSQRYGACWRLDPIYDAYGRYRGYSVLPD
jgi:hypothetical protein